MEKSDHRGIGGRAGAIAMERAEVQIVGDLMDRGSRGFDRDGAMEGEAAEGPKASPSEAADGAAGGQDRAPPGGAG